MEPIRDFDPEGDIIALSFATRLLLTDLDKSLIVERSFESLADFGRTDRVGIFLLDQTGEKLIAAGGMISEPHTDGTIEFPVEGAVCEEVLSSKLPAQYPVTYIEGIPWPTREGGEPGRHCLCAPLVAANNNSIGIVTFDHPEDLTLTPIIMQPLIVLLTVVAIALETTRLFQQAVYDGLTGLYVRRYFDLRLSEEENRIKRYGGKLAILITDIDHFKKFNDQYGHQQGDTVLRETAEILKKSVRKSLDAVCRYGGEEFVVIMPDTDLAGATVVAERIRQRCQEHDFPGADRPLKVTLSGGLAYMDQDTHVPGKELLERADSLLYKAKKGGRNQIWIQEEDG